MVAAREFEALLRGSEEDDDVRLEAFEQLKDLSQGPKAVAVLIEGLHYRSAVVRSEAASVLQFKDVESDDRIVPALREALARERDPDVLDELEATLESVDRQQTRTLARTRRRPQGPQRMRVPVRAEERTEPVLRSGATVHVVARKLGTRAELVTRARDLTRGTNP